MKSLLYILLGSLGIWGFISIGNPFAGSSENLALPDEVDYNFHIRPILSDKCFACHGPDANNREAGLRLDEPEQALAELPESPGKFAWTPKNLKQSEAIHYASTIRILRSKCPPQNPISPLVKQKLPC